MSQVYDGHLYIESERAIKDKITFTYSWGIKEF